TPPSSHFERTLACCSSFCTTIFGFFGSVPSTGVKSLGPASCPIHRIRRPSFASCIPMPSPIPPKPASSWCDSSFMLSESALSGRAPIPENVDAIVGPVKVWGKPRCEGVILTPQVHFFENEVGGDYAEADLYRFRTDRGVFRGRGARPGLAREAGEAHRDLSAGRKLGPDGPGFRGEAVGDLGKAGDRREQARCCRLDRHGICGAPGERRLQLRDRQHRSRGREPPHDQGPL